MQLKERWTGCLKPATWCPDWRRKLASISSAALSRRGVMSWPCFMPSSATPLGSMMCVMPCGSIAGLYRPFEGRGHRVAMDSRTRASSVKRFWLRSSSGLDHLQTLSPGFGRGKLGKGVAHRFCKTIHLVDSTTIELVASCMDWDKHRRRKAVILPTRETKGCFRVRWLVWS